MDQLRKRCLAADRRAADAEGLATDSERMRLQASQELESMRLELAKHGGGVGGASMGAKVGTGTLTGVHSNE